MSENLYPHSLLTGMASRIIPVSEGALVRINKGLARRVHGVFASRKNRCSLTWRTREEFDLLRLLEVDPNVLTYETLPERVMIYDEDQTISHYPAAKVVTARKTMVFDAFKSPIPQGRLNLISMLTEVYAMRGISYHAFPGAELRTQPRIDNARFILAHRGFYPDLEASMAIEAAVAIAGRISLAKLQVQLPRVSEVVAAACAMAMDGNLRLDLAAPTPLQMVAFFPQVEGLQ